MRETLARLVSPGAVRPESCNAAFAVRGVVPSVVLEPSCADEAAAALAACSEHGWTVECAGAGTWLHQGRTPARVDVLLSSVRLRGITEYEPDDVTLGVRAGTKLREVAEATAKHRQFALLDGPAAAAATVGAMLATAAAGPLRASAGTPRDQALGIEVVTGDGRLLRFGGRVVKNVAGYDVVRLLVGSCGTLGFITAVHLRLRALPESEVRLRAEADALEPLADLATRLAVHDPAFLEIVADGRTRPRLLVAFRGNADATEDAARRTCKESAELKRVDDEGGLDEVLAAEAEADVAIVLRGPAAALAETLRVASALARNGGLTEAAIAAHAADGIVRLFGGTGQETASRFTPALEEARRSLAGPGCGVGVPVPPAGVEDFQPWQAHAATLTIMRRLRGAFDPAGVLAPGRFVV